MTMQLRQIEYFVAVAEERHFTRAAAATHVAQPSLSKQVHALERELGTPLFTRARGNIALTPAGETLLPIARRILADADDARRQVQEVVGLARGRLRLGATPSLSTVLLPQALAQFCETFPAIDIHIEERGGRDLVRLVAEGELDLALIVLPLQTRDPALTTTEILREPLVVAAPADGSLLARRSIHVRDLARHPLVMYREGYDLREVTLTALRREGVEPRIAVEGGELDAVLSLVEAGLGVAVVPSMVVDGRPGLRAVPFVRPGMSRTIGFARRRDVELSATGRAFRQLLEAHLAELVRAKSLPRGVEVIGGASRSPRSATIGRT